MKSWKLMMVLLGSMVALGGCVSLVVPSRATPNGQVPYLSGKERQARVLRQKYFMASGAFSLTELGEKPILANYRWLQNNANFYRINISSALNLFSVRILGRLHSVTLWKGPRKHVTRSTPEGLIKREIGWTLPVRNLFYWIRGVGAPGRKHLTFDEQGHLIALRQNGWEITYSKYITVKGYDLPRSIVLTRTHPYIELKIVVKHWILTNKRLPLQ